MRRDALRQALHEGRTLYGAFVSLQDPASIEVVGRAGFDFAVIDAEHFPFSPSLVAALVSAAERAQVAPFVRVGDFGAVHTLPYLEVGAWGLFFPHTRNPAVARAAVDAVRYPPQGTRGFHGETRAGGFGFDDTRTLFHRAAEETLVVCQIEDAEAVERAAAIAATPGLDGVMIGPYDLAVSCGRPGEVRSAEHRALIERIAADVRTQGRFVATYLTEPEDVRWCEERDIRMLICRSDLGLLAGALRATVAAFRSAGSSA